MRATILHSYTKVVKGFPSQVSEWTAMLLGASNRVKQTFHADPLLSVHGAL